MSSFKLFADLLTSLRAFLVLVLVWLGLSEGAQALDVVVLVMLLSWISDYFDGFLARKSQPFSPTWIGSHDLQIDVLVGSALLAYLSFSGFLPGALAIVYLVLWLLFFGLRGMPKAYGAVFQAPIYGYFLWLAWQQGSWALLYVLAWLGGNLLFTWRRLVFTLIPEFFAGLRGFGKRNRPKAG